MDFDLAAKRLQRDQQQHQQQLRKKKQNLHQRTHLMKQQASSSSSSYIHVNGGGGGGGSSSSSSSMHLYSKEQLQQQQQKLRLEERQRKIQFQKQIRSYMQQWDTHLGVQSLASSTISSGMTNTTASHNNWSKHQQQQQQEQEQHLQLAATSIYGEGDKVTLPPSVLETLVMLQQQQQSDLDETQQQPWTFRIGILNPNYTFPASSILQSLPTTISNTHDDGNYNMDDEVGDDDDDDDDDRNVTNTEAYLDELRYKYITYTHGTVIEFTQDEGCIGIPEPIAHALLNYDRNPYSTNTIVETTRTIDKATCSNSNEASGMDMNVDSDVDEDIDAGINDDTGSDHVRDGSKNMSNMIRMDDDEEKTPGHLAWGVFDIPKLPIEITMVRLPKGKSVTLRPTHTAIQGGFYHLKDIKFVLEQSLIRTRATLTVGDTIHTWHRGTKFDLLVMSVTPATYQAVSCINTDIEIEFDVESLPSSSLVNDSPTKDNPLANIDNGTKSVGRRLNEPTVRIPKHASTSVSISDATTSFSDLLCEPPMDQQQNVITIQFRYNHIKGQRRYDIHIATIRDLFHYVEALCATTTTTTTNSICTAADDVGDCTIQLVTRFPRRVYTTSQPDGSMSLYSAGFVAGQELLILEKV
jgi:Ubiquitin fusion degradation protein UFD1